MVFLEQKSNPGCLVHSPLVASALSLAPAPTTIPNAACGADLPDLTLSLERGLPFTRLCPSPVLLPLPRLSIHHQDQLEFPLLQESVLYVIIRVLTDTRDV